MISDFKSLSDEQMAQLQAELKAETERRKRQRVQVWRITTEGDCEGRTVNNIATEEGDFAELALKYAGHAGYSLNLEPVPIADRPKSRPALSASVSVPYFLTDSQDKSTQVKVMQNWLGDNYEVTASNYYRTVIITKKQ